MYEEIKCPICNEFYNTEGRIPIILNNCDHNICQECLFLTPDNKCPLDGKSINISQISVNKIFLNLIEDLNNKDSTIFLPEDPEMKEKEEKLNIQIDLISEYLRIIQSNYFIDDKQEYINNTKKNVYNDYCNAKENIEKYYSKYKSLTPKIETVIKDLDKNYLTFNNSILNEFEKDTNEIKEKYLIYQKEVNSFLDKLNKNIILKNFNLNEYLIESDEIIIKSEDILSKVNEYNEKTTKIFFKIKDINLELIMSTSKIPRRVKVHYIQRKSKDLLHYNDDEEEDSHLTRETLSNKNDETHRTKSSYSFEGKKISSAKLNGSFTFNPDTLSLGVKHKQKKLTRDNIVFIKNKMKNDNINCSGYSIGDEGVKKLLELLIKKNLEKKTDSSKKNNYKDLKLSKCDLSNEGLGYVKSILDVSKNTIIHLNLSRNYFNDHSINYIYSIIKQNSQLKEFKINDNNFSSNGKQQIELFVKENNPKLRIEL